MTTPTFAHIDDKGNARMVDISDKRPTQRMARAKARVHLGDAVARQLAKTGSIAKGNVMETARIAGIMAAKKTPELIPMCHKLNLNTIEINMLLGSEELTILAEVRGVGLTGVEMEAMTAVAVAALTIYDMCKSASKAIQIESIHLLAKSGGKSGNWRATDCKNL